MWELEWLKQNGLLAKTLLVMPETPHEAPSGVIRTTGTDDRIFDAGMRRFDAAEHTLDLAKEWPELQRVAETFHLQLPSLAVVGAMFTMDPTTGTVKEIVPLGLSTIVRRSTYLRNTVARLGLLPTPKTLPDFIQDYSNAVFWSGTTLEYALMRAADGYVLWGDDTTALGLIERVVSARQSDDVVASYVNGLPDLIEERLGMNDVGAARHYVEFVNRVGRDARLVALITSDTSRRVADLAWRTDIRPN